MLNMDLQEIFQEYEVEINDVTKDEPIIVDNFENFSSGIDRDISILKKLIKLHKRDEKLKRALRELEEEKYRSIIREIETF